MNNLEVPFTDKDRDNIQKILFAIEGDPYDREKHPGLLQLHMMTHEEIHGDPRTSRKGMKQHLEEVEMHLEKTDERVNDLVVDKLKIVFTSVVLTTVGGGIVAIVGLLIAYFKH